jgi:hypothetical protein
MSRKARSGRSSGCRESGVGANHLELYSFAHAILGAPMQWWKGATRRSTLRPVRFILRGSGHSCPWDASTELWHLRCFVAVAEERSPAEGRRRRCHGPIVIFADLMTSDHLAWSSAMRACRRCGGPSPRASGLAIGSACARGAAHSGKALGAGAKISGFSAARSSSSSRTRSRCRVMACPAASGSCAFKAAAIATCSR